MKFNKLITSAMLSFGLVTVASAQNVINLTGSTAFRSQCYTVLSTATNVGGVFDTTPDTIATFGNAAPNKGTWMLFHGNINGAATYVDCFWSGSEAGIASVCQTNLGFVGAGKINFLKTDGTVSGVQTNSGSPSSTQTNATAVFADLAMADTSKAVSLSANLSAQEFGQVAVVPFTFVKNLQSAPLAAWTRIGNLSDAQARILLTFPQLCAFFTGVAGDTNNYVYAVGRNAGSGTRVNCLLDTQYGVSTPVVQFAIGGFPTFTNGNASTLFEVDNNGYESGGDVAKALGVDGTQTTADPNFGTTGYMAIGYLGISDASTANIATNWLTFNGVAESNGSVEEGQYSYWGNEHLYGTAGISGFKGTFGSNFITQVGNSAGGSVAANKDTGIQLKFMHASKTTDGADPTHD